MNITSTIGTRRVLNTAKVKGVLTLFVSHSKTEASAPLLLGGGNKEASFANRIFLFVIEAKNIEIYI